MQPLAFVSKGAAVAVASADLAPHAPAPAVVAVSAPELAERLAWRVPRLEFNDTPLREAVELFNRHGDVRLSLGSPALGDLHVSGTVRADNTPALLQLLRADYGVEVRRVGDREFVMSRPR
jgi:transmembrane sensor